MIGNGCAINGLLQRMQQNQQRLISATHEITQENHIRWAFTNLSVQKKKALIAYISRKSRAVNGHIPFPRSN